jgi:hypothetical protein
MNERNNEPSENSENIMKREETGKTSVVDLHHIDADPDADPHPTFHSDADTDPDPASHNDTDPCGSVSRCGSGSGYGSESATLAETARTVLKYSSRTQVILLSWLGCE